MYGPRALFRFTWMGGRTSLWNSCGHGTRDTHDISEGRLCLSVKNVANLGEGASLQYSTIDV
jgi:hypothetical protein